MSKEMRFLTIAEKKELVLKGKDVPLCVKESQKSILQSLRELLLHEKNVNGADYISHTHGIETGKDRNHYGVKKKGIKL